MWNPFRRDGAATRGTKLRMPQDPADVGYASTILANLPVEYSVYSANQFPAVKKAVQRLSGDVSSLPISVEYRDGDQWLPVDQDDAEAQIVGHRWRPYQTAQLGIEVVMRSLALHGIAAVEVMTNEREAFEGLLVHDPRQVSRIRSDVTPGAPVETQVLGRVIPRGRLALLYWEPPFDEVTVRAPLADCWGAIRAGLAAMLYSAHYVENGMVGRVFLKPSESQAASAGQRGQREAQDKYEKLAKSQRLMGRGERILTPGMDVAFGPGGSADALDGMERRAVEQVSRILGPPAPMLDNLERATYSNIREARKDYVNAIVARWADKIGKELSRAIWPGGERRVRLSVEESALMSRMERAQALQVGIFSGVISQNEAREHEGLEKSDDEGADQLIRSPTYMPPMTGGGEG